jgi:endoglucanase
MKNLIRRLCETPGPSGFESGIRKLIEKEVESYVDEIRMDNLGNLIARKGKTRSGSRKIMVAAHMDEIGFMVTHIDEGGYVRFLPLGGVNASACIGSRVRMIDGLPGLISAERKLAGAKPLTFENMFIDLGYEDQADCPVQVGDVAVFDYQMIDLGDRLVAKALDDRVGVAVLLETLRRISEDENHLSNEIYFVFTVQEEVGLRGAAPAAFGIEPDLGFAVDVTRTGDTPKALRMSVDLGKGPAVKVRDQRLIADPRVVSWMVSAAEKKLLPYQLEVLERGSTDAGAFQLVQKGVPAGCLSIPCRYLHTPSEMVDFRDVENAVGLMIELLTQPVSLS